MMREKRGTGVELEELLFGRAEKHLALAQEKESCPVRKPVDDPAG
jgi:hypothetical protein